MATNHLPVVRSLLAKHSGEDISIYIQELLSKGKKEVTILLIGRVGRGKSALVNILFGHQVVKEEMSAYGVTEDVSCHVTKHGDIEVTVIDTPGFFDSKHKKPSDILIAEIVKKVPGHQVDLILFCVKLGDRFEQSDADIIQLITNVFGLQIWKNSMFALTFANKLDPPRKAKDVDMKVYFNEKCAEMTQVIHQELQDSGQLSKELSSRVPVVPVGDDEPQLPHCDDWFTPFWYTVFKQIHERAKPAFLQLSLKRFSNSPQPPRHQPSSHQHKILVRNLEREIGNPGHGGINGDGEDPKASFWDQILMFLAKYLPCIFGP